MKRSLIPSELSVQKAVFQWSRLASGRYPELFLLYHVWNGGSRNIKEAAHMKSAGVRKGIPDLQLDVARGPYHGLRIELKRPGGKLSPDQDEWLSRLTAEGYCCRVCYSAEEAIREIQWYLDYADIASATEEMCSKS